MVGSGGYALDLSGGSESMHSFDDFGRHTVGTEAVDRNNPW